MRTRIQVGVGRSEAISNALGTVSGVRDLFWAKEGRGESRKQRKASGRNSMRPRVVLDHSRQFQMKLELGKGWNNRRQRQKGGRKRDGIR